MANLNPFIEELEHASLAFDAREWLASFRNENISGNDTQEWITKPILTDEDDRASVSCRACFHGDMTLFLAYLTAPAMPDWDPDLDIDDVNFVRELYSHDPEHTNAVRDINYQVMQEHDIPLVWRWSDLPQHLQEKALQCDDFNPPHLVNAIDTNDVRSWEFWHSFCYLSRDVLADIMEWFWDNPVD